MYIYPVDQSDQERIEVISDHKNNGKPTLVLKTYGLPMVFWSYLAASLAVIGAMWLASRAAVVKLISYDDPTLQALGYLVQYTLLLAPVILLGFFFYEKHLKKSGPVITIVYRVFFLPFFAKKIVMDEGDSLSVDHFMDSPNMAKIYNKAELKGFENKGYFELHAKSKGKIVLVDRHSRKADLIKLKDLLNSY